MHIRFAIHSKDEDSGKRQGLFQALVAIRESGLLYEYELVRVKEIHTWFNQYLDKPASFRRSSRLHALNKAISWFKDSAKEHIAYMRELATILEGHGFEVAVLQTDRPGYIVYEDAHQITAEPFSETGA
ncbi:MAG TPA: hypothetical protein ENJ35_00525 [Gammaproteobacteria bacterium]|nr:hypothetical protein [Gammaproteobacteria bacterium]